MPYTDFHYTPTGTGVISGKEVLEQTEDAINDLGTQISGDVQTAIDTANNALNVASTASTDAQNAVNTANTAYTAATNAQNTANTAQTTATNAQTAAQNAQNDVNALGNRVTTAENNISQNTTDISGLTTRMGTAEGNITTLQNDVVTAQGTATSAQNTATMARQQAYVLRYSSTAITDNSTIAYSTLDNTDNIKADDKIIDVDGKIFSIVSVDSDNSTVTVGSALIDLALDANVMHLSGDETASGQKTFSDMSSFQGSYLGNEASANARSDLILESNRDTHGQSGIFLTKFRQNKAQGAMSGNDVAYLSFDCLENSVRTNNGLRINFLNFVDDIPQRFILWSGITERLLGAVGFPWSGVYATNYYYGNDNVEFSTKFVTTDTAQTVDGNKTFSKYITSDGSNIGDEYSNNARTNLWLMGTRDTEDVSGVLFDTFRQNTAQGTGGHLLGISIKENGIRYEGCRFAWGWNNNLNGYSFSFRPTLQGANQAVEHNLGTSTDKWDTINGINPGALSLPDLNNGIDISGYITVNGGNKKSLYTPPANGWISVALTRTGGGSVAVLLKQGNIASSGHKVEQENGTGSCNAMLPVKGGVQVSINSALADGIAFAYFYPCLGNV